MRSLEYPADTYPTDGVDLVGAYMRFIAQNEPDHRSEIQKLPRGSVRRASLIVARACIIGCSDMDAAKRITQGIRQEILEYNPRPLREQHQHVVNTTRLIEARGNDSQLTQVRQAIVIQDIGLLRRTSDKALALQKVAGKGQERRKELTRELAGERAEHRAISFLNRPMHPWMMAVRALPHHDKQETTGDKSKVHKNFDMVVVEDSPLAEQSVFSKLQVKSNCFSECARPRDRRELKEGWRMKEMFRAKYDSDITIISGCCDFEVAGTHSRTLDNFALEEVRGRLFRRNRPTLEIASSQIMLLATGGLEAERNGTFDPTVPRLAYSSDDR